MLILKPRDQLTAEDIRNFCHRFDEGIRVEYKSEFNQDVRDDLPKAVSSFANSYGGLLLVGVRTQQGRVIEPIEGFEKPSREELPLTVENICHQHIYPMLTPRVTEVASDVPGKVFLLIEVEPSPEAPHAIENSRKVYVRTGSASKPYDLADIELIERLIKRRENVLRRRREFKSESNTLVERFGQQPAYPKVRVTVGPLYPHTEIVDRETVFQFLRDTRFKGGHFYNIDQLRRLPEGACGTRLSGAFGYLDTFGHVCHQEVVTCQQLEGLSRYDVVDFIHPLLQAICCSSRLYRVVGYKGEVFVEATAFDLLGHVCLWPTGMRVEKLEPSVERIPGEYDSASEFLWENALDITTALTHQVVWPMKTGFESITEEQVRRIVARILADYRP